MMRNHPNAYLPWKKCPNRRTTDRTIKSGIYVLKFVAKNVPRIKPTVIPKSRLISRFMSFTSFFQLITKEAVTERKSQA
jgi:hypothetical protein